MFLIQNALKKQEAYYKHFYSICLSLSGFKLIAITIIVITYLVTAKL